MNWSERAFLTRWQLALIVLVLFAAVGTSIAFGIAAVSASHRASDASRRAAVVQRAQQANRITAIQELCERDNANAAKNKAFIHRVNPQLDGVAKKVFTETGDCHSFALKTVKRRPALP
jgi:Flp pilus assembly protein TadG